MSSVEANQRDRRAGVILWIIIAVSLSIHAFFLIASHTFLLGQQWIHQPVHACVEFSGAMIAFLVAILLISMQSRGQGTSFNVWIAGALIGMGILDGMHAAVKPGELFVWLHSTATLLGGVLFVLVWLPASWASKVERWWHWAVFAFALLFGTLSLMMPDWIPTMAVASRFTPWARGLNITGGVLLAVAAVRIIRNYFATRNVDDLLFCLHCSLFGSAAIMFDQSDLWDAAWWGWHLLRLLAYSVALVFVVNSEQGIRRALASTSRELLQLNATLEKRVEKRTAEMARQAAELAKEQYLLNSLVESIPDPVFFKDKESRFMRVNRVMATDTGFADPADLIGKTDADIWFGRDFQKATLRDEQRILETGKAIISKEENPINLNGEPRCVLVTKMPLYDESGEIIGTFGIARDISDRKRNEVALNRLNDELARSNQDLEQFAYVASHDLSEPLRAVAGFTELLREQYGDKLDETASVYMDYVVDGARRMQTLISSLLDFSRVGSRGNPMEPTDLNEILDVALMNLAKAIEENGAEVVKSELPTVVVDRAQIVRVFQNLIGNAIKFRGDRPPRVQIECEQDEQQWRFSVRDNGIGISSQHQRRVFEIFKRLHGRGEYPGTGMGLTICERILVRHGGRIWVESEPGEGSCFIFTLPQTTT